MYAIVEIAGQQFKVVKDQTLFVHRLQDEEGSTVTFDRVLLTENDGKVTLGAPAIKGASITVKVEVIVFKKKRRKGYKLKKGHRQYLTKLTVTAIS